MDKFFKKLPPASSAAPQVQLAHVERGSIVTRSSNLDLPVLLIETSKKPNVSFAMLRLRPEV